MTSPLTKRWLVAPAGDSRAAALAATLSLPLPIARALVQRGFVEPAAARQFLQPQLRHLSDPFALPDMRAAVDRLLTAIDRRERIVLYGDYDVDGLSATALLVRVLRAAGAEVATFLPHRFDEGYGLSPDGLARCLAEHQPRLLVAVDCGTTAVAEIAGLQPQRIDVIVVDHHEPGAELPQCVAVVNPKRRGGRGSEPQNLRGSEPQNLRGSELQKASDAEALRLCRSEALSSPLASVGLAFKLAHALQKQGRDTGRPWATTLDLREQLELVALGTVADVVPLTGENRILTRAGLERLPATRAPGLRALLEVAAVPERVTSYHVGFRLGPRLNAAGRLGDAAAALELLLTADCDRARVLADLLNQHNAERQRIEQRILAEARAAAAQSLAARPDDPVLVVAGEGWHVGVIGIVAARLVQEFYRPAVVIGLAAGVGRGSCRSIAGFSIVAGLDACAALLDAHGGHAMAAGLTLPAANVDPLRRQLNAHAAALLGSEALRPIVRIDAELSLAEVDRALVDAVARFEPCGADNPAPVFAVRGVRVQGIPRRLGQDHLRFTVTDGGASCPAVWWGGAGRGVPAGPIDVAFVPEVDDYWGPPVVQLKVRDIRPAE